MTVIMAMARAMGMPVNLEMMLGTMMGGAPSAASWILGFIIHLVAGGIFKRCRLPALSCRTWA